MKVSPSAFPLILYCLCALIEPATADQAGSRMSIPARLVTAVHYRGKIAYCASVREKRVAVGRLGRSGYFAPRSWLIARLAARVRKNQGMKPALRREKLRFALETPICALPEPPPPVRTIATPMPLATPTPTRTPFIVPTPPPIETIAPTPTVEPLRRIPLGMNPDGAEYWSSQLIFVDLFKQSSAWVASNANGSGPFNTGATVPLGPTGYPIVVPFLDADKPELGPQLAKVLAARINGKYPPGKYTLILEGKGEVELKIDGGNRRFSAPGTYAAEIRPTNGGVAVVVRRSERDDPIRRISLILPGFGEEHLFHPGFLSRLPRGGVLRMMDLMKTNGSPVRTWQDRTTVGYYSQALPSGMAPEYLIRLANIVEADPWFCIPHQADDEYVRQLARLVRNTLDPRLKIYLEYSNETWNWIFPQTSYVYDRGWNSFVTKRSLEIFKLFEEELGTGDRLVRIIATQAANFGITDKRLEALDDTAVNPNNQRIDALAIGGYFGGEVANEIMLDGKVDTISVEEILDRAERSLELKTIPRFEAQLRRANDRNIELIVYEGGQHLVAKGQLQNDEAFTAKLIAANRHPRMRGLYRRLFSEWYSRSPGMFAVFSYIGLPGKYGCWGILEYEGQPYEEAPKYQAYLDKLGELSSGEPINAR